MKKLNWEEIEASGNTEYKRMEAGGYVCTIVSVEDLPSKEYLLCLFDIAEGDLKNHFADEFYNDKPWAHKFYASYKEAAQGMFKHMVDCMESSNKGFKWDGEDESAFVGKQVGIIFQEEKYLNNSGEVKARLNKYTFATADDIRKGNFKVPVVKVTDDAQKVLDEQQAASIKTDTYDDVPF